MSGVAALSNVTRAWGTQAQQLIYGHGFDQKSKSLRDLPASLLDR